jgi:hypothetical protein
LVKRLVSDNRSDVELLKLAGSHSNTSKLEGLEQSPLSDITDEIQRNKIFNRIKESIEEIERQGKGTFGIGFETTHAQDVQVQTARQNIRDKPWVYLVKSLRKYGRDAWSKLDEARKQKEAQDEASRDKDAQQEEKGRQRKTELDSQFNDYVTGYEYRDNLVGKQGYILKEIKRLEQNPREDTNDYLKGKYQWELQQLKERVQAIHTRDDEIYSDLTNEFYEENERLNRVGRYLSNKEVTGVPSRHTDKISQYLQGKLRTYLTTNSPPEEEETGKVQNNVPFSNGGSKQKNRYKSIKKRRKTNKGGKSNHKKRKTYKR